MATEKSGAVPKWKRFLYNRGITDREITFYQIEPARVEAFRVIDGDPNSDIGYRFVLDSSAKAEGWRYPITYIDDPDTIIHRFKFFPADAETVKKRGKNRGLAKHQLPHGGRHPSLYIAHKTELEEIMGSVQANGKRLYGFEGEFDKILVSRLEWLNIVSIFGVGNIPESIVDDIASLGAAEFHYFMDGDWQGVGAAHKLHNLFYYSRVRFFAHPFPQMWNGKKVKDATDLFLACNSDLDEFREAMTLIEQSVMPFPKVTRNRRKKISKENYPDLFTEIERRIHAQSRHGIRNFKNNGFSNNIECLFSNHEHDHVSPGAAWNHETGVFYCQKCPAAYSPEEVVDKLGIDINDYVKDEQMSFDEFYNHKKGDFDLEEFKSLAFAGETKDDQKNQQQTGKSNKVNPHEASSWSANRSLVPVTADWSAVPIERFVKRRSDSLQRYEQRVYEKADTESIYLPFPIDDEQFYRLGGYCRVLKAGKLVLVFAPSSGGKTTFITHMLMKFNLLGYHTMIWSPEFDEDEHTDRIAQQNGAPSMARMIEHDQYLFERKHQTPFKFGRPLEERERERSRIALQTMRNWAGENYLLDTYGTNVFDVLALADRAYDYALNVHGHRIQVFFFDYAQLPQDPQGFYKWDVNDTAKTLKEWCGRRSLLVSEFTGKPYERLPVVGVMGSQVTKASSKSFKTGERDIITDEDSQVLRSDWFNLILGLQWGSTVNQHGWQSYIVNVWKNSIGKRLTYQPDQSEKDVLGKVCMWFNPKRIGLVYESMGNHPMPEDLIDEELSRQMNGEYTFPPLDLPSEAPTAYEINQFSENDELYAEPLPDGYIPLSFDMPIPEGDSEWSGENEGDNDHPF